MINVKEVFDFVNYISNKDVNGNTMTPNNFNDIIKIVNIEFLKKRYGLPENYQQGLPISNISYEISQKITDDLSHLKVVMGRDVGLISINDFGIATYPSDYLHFSSFFSFTKVNGEDKYNSGEVVSDAQLPDRLSNSITYPTKKNPILTFYSKSIQFYPKNISNVQFTYIRLPKTPLFSSDIINDEPVYNEENSVDFEYPYDCITDICSMILGYIGINIKDNELLSIIENKKIRG